MRGDLEWAQVPEGNEFGIDGLSDFRPIGSGGFSSVYAAWDAGFERWVAVKVLYNLDESGRRRFDRERVILGRLSQHRDVVTPFRSGYTNNRAPYLVMEYIGGGSLERAIEARGPLPWREVFEYLVPVTDALSFAHGEGILHRDIKPDNILLAHGGAKLADFGIAAIREATATSVAFTLAHSPPETFVGGSDARDERSDIYSLVSTLYTGLAGRAPFEVDGPDSQPAYMVRIADNPAPSLPEDLASAAVIDLIERGLSKDPDHRPQTAAALRAELVEIVRSADGPAGSATGGATVAAHGWEPPSSSPSGEPPPASSPSGEPSPSPSGESLSSTPAVGPPSWEPPASSPGVGPESWEPPASSPDVEPAPWASRHQGQVGPSDEPSSAPHPPTGSDAPPAEPVDTVGDRATEVSGEPAPPWPAAPVAGPGSGTPRAGDTPFPVPPASGKPPGRRRAPIVAAVVAAVVVVVGAGVAAQSFLDGDQPDTSDEATETAASDAAGTDGGAGTTEDDGTEELSPAPDRPLATAGEGGNLRLLQWQAPTVANAYLAEGTRDLLAGSLVLESLAEWTPDGTIRPVLAAEIPTVANGGISGDLTEVRWTLRGGVLWSDGSPFAADDVVFTWEYCTAVDSDCSSEIFNEVRSVTALDELTVSITFDEPTPFPFIPFVGAASPVLQREQFQDCLGAAASCDDDQLRPIGTGPYLITELRPDDGVDYELNPNYRLVDEGKPFFATVEILGGGDAESAARSVLELGEADYAWNLQVAPDTLASLEAGGQGRVEVAFTSNVEHLNLNQTDPDGASPSDYAGGTNPNPVFFQNPTLARALSLAIDRNELVAASYGPLGMPACNMWHLPSQRTTNNDWCLRQDIAEANRILDEDLGYVDTDGDGIRELPDGTPLEFEIVTSTNAVRQATQGLIQAHWDQIGVRTILRNEDPLDFFGVSDTDVSIWQFYTDIQLFTNGAAGPDAQSYLAGWTSDQIPTPDNGWAGTNFPRLADDTYDALHAELTATPLTDPARDSLVIQLDDIISAGSGSTIPLVLRGNVSAFGVDLDGVGELNGWDSEYYNIEDWFRAS